MHIAVFGTATVGRVLAAGFAEHGHQVIIGTRSVADTMARSEPDERGQVAYRVWQEDHPTISLASFADAARASDVIVNATSGMVSESALAQAGASNLAGKVILDVSNPLDFSNGFPPTLDPVNTDSIGERLQRAFPESHVVKTLNTVNANVMVRPSTLGKGDHTIFICGDDGGAKSTVKVLLAELGWGDVIDLGDIASARGMEMYLPLWLRLMGALGTADFNVKVVR
jgi:predicted dinucleotide-binding enzyme